eukprot:scaffold475855_cov48-Prasinocladus_malaysianus.AAC.1
MKTRLEHQTIHTWGHDAKHNAPKLMVCPENVNISAITQPLLLYHPIPTPITRHGRGDKSAGATPEPFCPCIAGRRAYQEVEGVHRLPGSAAERRARCRHQCCGVYATALPLQESRNTR